MKSNQDLINNQIEVDLKQIVHNVADSMTEIETQLVQRFVKQIQEELVPNGLVKENQTHLASMVQKLELDKFTNIRAILDQVKCDVRPHMILKSYWMIINKKKTDCMVYMYIYKSGF